MESAVLLGHGWTLLWVFATAAYLLFAVGSFVLIRQRIPGVTGQLLSTVSALVVPLVLVAFASATYSTRALIKSESSASVATEQIPLAMNIMEATTDGVMLALSVLFGALVFTVGYGLRSEPTRWRLAGLAGMALGAICTLVNLGLLITAGQSFIGIVTVVAVSLWLLPIGWFIHRNPANSVDETRSLQGTPD